MQTEKPIEPIAYGAADAAKRIGVSRATIDRMIADGELKAKRARNRVLISESEIRRFLDSDD